VIRDPRCNRGRGLDGLVLAAKIVPPEVQRYSRAVILHFLAETVGEPS
jgi:hypothetical protein